MSGIPQLAKILELDLATDAITSVMDFAVDEQPVDVR
jgi:hypothetical protein